MLIFTTVILAGCMPGDGSCNLTDRAGIFSGIWHGWIAPISLIRGLFNDNIRVYEVFNNGWLYDFGFYIAVVGGFGSINIIRNKKKERD
ncbi:hypothetical protein PV797_19220 [Clostridiaceae bacterium M8S5]|nr:hypothetical protein PV797_19220 [Clostridiaceae bacterium M8S5]